MAVDLPQIKWPVHDRSRPAPRVVTPGQSALSGDKPPSDAIVLFDGKDLSQWTDKKGGAPKWKVANGYFETVPHQGPIQTKRPFGDCQLHIEWATPNPPDGKDQERGNSGIYLMNNYELQVLDSYQAKTYSDGQAASVYGQYPPLVNASLPPGKFQTYDIVFHGPRFDTAGKLAEAATITVLHNGVLVQDHVTLTGPTAHGARPAYKQHAAKLPLSLQDHNHPVRYRNVWIRELED